MGDFSDLMISRLRSDEEIATLLVKNPDEMTKAHKEDLNIMQIKDVEWSHKQNTKNGIEEIEIKRDISEYIHNTGIKAKRENWSKFAKFIENQFNHGGDKYSLPDQPDKEMTDLLCEMSPGKTGIDWIMQTIAKYCGRYINFEREKDLFKIATFAYIAWLKKGYHLKEEHDEDTSKEKED